MGRVPQWVIVPRASGDGVVGSGRKAIEVMGPAWVARSVDALYADRVGGLAAKQIGEGDGHHDIKEHVDGGELAMHVAGSVECMLDAQEICVRR